MSIFKIIALIFLIIFLGTYFELQPAILKIADGIASVFQFEDKGANPALFDMAFIMVLLITLVGIVKVIFSGKREDDD